MGLDPIPIIVTGAGAPGVRGTIYALQNNDELRKVRIIGVDTDAEAVGRFFTDAFYVVPAPEHESYSERLLEVCTKERATVILPQTTREINLLSRRKCFFQEHGIKIMVSNPDAIEIANSKTALLHIFDEMGLPYPAFHVARCEEDLVKYARALGYPHVPVVVKPPFSSGMRGMRVLRDIGSWDVSRFLQEKPIGLEITIEDLLKILRRGPSWPELFVSEFLPGPEYSVDAFVGEKMAVAIPRLRKAIRSGITFRSETELRDDMSQLTLRVAQNIGLRYAFGFQYKLDATGAPKVLECNPRIQGTMVASVFAGVNVIWCGVKELLGEHPSEMQQPLANSGFHRFWGGVGTRDGRSYEI
jgi:carbamoyl-phosphate synthase large subunit